MIETVILKRKVIVCVLKMAIMFCCIILHLLAASGMTGHLILWRIHGPSAILKPSGEVDSFQKMQMYHRVGWRLTPFLATNQIGRIDGLFRQRTNHHGNRGIGLHFCIRREQMQHKVKSTSI
jgi:hypothetical protein